MPHPTRARSAAVGQTTFDTGTADEGRRQRRDPPVDIAAQEQLELASGLSEPRVPIRPVATESRRRSAADLLQTPGALLTRSHLRELGLERRAIDAVFRALPIVALPGYSRPLIRAEEYHELIDEHTYRDDRVRPIARV